MVKLQIGANTIYLTKQEQDFLFQLLDNKYEQIQNIPTFNAIHNWLIDIGCRAEVVKSKTQEDEPLLRKTISELSKKNFDKKCDYFQQLEDSVEDPWGYLPGVSKDEVDEIRKSWSNIENKSEGETKQKIQDIRNEWSNVYENDDYKALRKLLGELLNGDNEKGYYVAL